VTETKKLQLCDVHTGEQAIIASLSGGSGFLGRMSALGFTPGTLISVVRNYDRGPIIVSVRDTQIALGRGQASRVQVHKESEP